MHERFTYPKDFSNQSTKIRPKKKVHELDYGTGLVKRVKEIMCQDPSFRPSVGLS
jgi:hypothetical protein